MVDTLVIATKAAARRPKLRKLQVWQMLIVHSHQAHSPCRRVYCVFDKHICGPDLTGQKKKVHPR